MDFLQDIGVGPIIFVNRSSRRYNWGLSRDNDGFPKLLIRPAISWGVTWRWVVVEPIKIS